jgi:hypothetical protein
VIGVAHIFCARLAQGRTISEEKALMLARYPECQ